MKIDPYNHKERYLSWKRQVEKEGIPEVSKYDSDLIIKYIYDMEMGLNVASGATKGKRGYPRLNNLKQRMIFFSKKFKEIYDFEAVSGAIISSFP